MNMKDNMKSGNKPHCHDMEKNRVELGLDEIKKSELETMKYIDLFCRKHGITYSLAGGSLLGAVRHKGFIPWDDDIDVLMMRNQYDKFVELWQNEKHDGYKLIHYKKTENYNYFFCKIVDLNTVLIENHTKPVEDMGVFVDIFPIDALGDEADEAKASFNSVNFKKYLAVANAWKHFYYNRNKSWLRQIPRFVFYCMSRCVNARKINERLEKRFPYRDNANYYGYLCGTYGLKEVMPREVFEKYSSLEFEGCDFMVLENYHRYLEALYGDYMKLPPVEKRITHHDFTAYKR
ncbi:MAG: LicD family protein [Lachnospiraceae bacterium]|nr:LicD family protein [Lachnospiraceae bacterium]